MIPQLKRICKGCGSEFVINEEDWYEYNDEYCVEYWDDVEYTNQYEICI